MEPGINRKVLLMDVTLIVWFIFLIILLFGGEGSRQLLKHRERMKQIEVDRLREQRLLEERRAELKQREYEQQMKTIFGQDAPLGITNARTDDPDAAKLQAELKDPTKFPTKQKPPADPSGN